MKYFYKESKSNKIILAGGRGGCVGVARVSNFSSKNPSLIIIYFFFFWGGGGARVSDFFY